MIPLGLLCSSEAYFYHLFTYGADTDAWLHVPLLPSLYYTPHSFTLLLAPFFCWSITFTYAIVAFIYCICHHKLEFQPQENKSIKFTFFFFWSNKFTFLKANLFNGKRLEKYSNLFPRWIGPDWCITKRGHATALPCSTSTCLLYGVPKSASYYSIFWFSNKQVKYSTRAYLTI